MLPKPQNAFGARRRGAPVRHPEGQRWGLESITATDGLGNTGTYTPAQIDATRGVFEYAFLTYDFTS
ncbi:MAG: hypothetical protein AB1941_29340 [Gemmatimonadota bacterium]